MKNLIIPAVVLFTLFSCNKSSSPNPSVIPVQDSLLKSYTLYNPRLHAKLVEIFTYDQASQLAGLSGYSYDSSGGAPIIDSSIISFILTDVSTPPASYDIHFHNDGDAPAGEVEHHALFYDNLNRVIQDSIVTSNVDFYSTQHFIYDDYGNTTLQWLFSNNSGAPGSYSVNQIDTMYIQSDNILTDILYSAVSVDIYRLFTRTYSTNINPLYNAALSNSLGCLLVFNNAGDYRSKNLPGQYIDQESGSPSVTINYLWTIDASGRVVQGVGTDGNTGMPEQIYNFTY
jgi:hypothetical protein